jgi:hypothetical protein
MVALGCDGSAHRLNIRRAIDHLIAGVTCVISLVVMEILLTRQTRWVACCWLLAWDQEKIVVLS